MVVDALSYCEGPRATLLAFRKPNKLPGRRNLAIDDDFVNNLNIHIICHIMFLTFPEDLRANVPNVCTQSSSL